MGLLLLFGGGGTDEATDDAVYAEYEIHIAWAGDVVNPFVIGESTLGGGDQLGGLFGTDFSGEHDNVSMDTKLFDIRRGRSDPMSDIQAGTCELVLLDTDGKYNPENQTSPLYGYITPMREVRIRALYDGNYYVLFRGFLRTAEYDPVTYETSIRCEDLFMRLDRTRPVVSPTTGKTGALIQEVLVASGFDQPAFTDVDVTRGDNVSNFSLEGTTDSRSGLGAIADLLESEQGLFFIAADGTATYRDRYTQRLTPASLVLSGVFRTAYPGVSLDNLYNVARVTKEGNTPQVAQDPSSIETFGPADITIESPYFESDAQAAGLAAYLVWQYRSPSAPVFDTPFVANYNNHVMLAALERELFDRVTLDDPDLAGDFYVESIAHRVEEGRPHQVSWRLNKRKEPAELFVIGESTLGGGDILAYY